MPSAPSIATLLPLPAGGAIAAEAIAPAPGRPLVVYLHGLGSRRGGEKASFFAEQLPARGFGFARFDFRGHGESSGRLDELSLTRQLEDLGAVLAWLASGEPFAAPRAVVLIGASLGALTAAWHSLRSPTSPLPIAAQVLIAPAFRILERWLDAIGPAGRAQWERDGTFRFHGPWFDFDVRWDAVVDARRYPHDELLAATRVPTLLLHGTRDESVPLRESVDFAARCASTRPRLVAIDGGDHRLTSAKERLLAEIVRFLDEVAAPCAR